MITVTPTPSKFTKISAHTSAIKFPKQRSDSIVHNMTYMKGTARTLVPTTKNYAPEPTLFGLVAEVSPVTQCNVQASP